MYKTLGRLKKIGSVANYFSSREGHVDEYKHGVRFQQANKQKHTFIVSNNEKLQAYNDPILSTGNTRLCVAFI